MWWVEEEIFWVPVGSERGLKMLTESDRWDQEKEKQSTMNTEK
jgi:hypothetical protein